MTDHVVEIIKEECMKRPNLVKEEHRSELQHAIVQACEQIDISPKDHLQMDEIQENRPEMLPEIEDYWSLTERQRRSVMLTGHCYVASEAFHHLVGGSPKFLRHEGSPHWYIKYGDFIADPTVEQFSEPPQYDEGTGKGFLTKEPSKRAQEIIEAVEERL